MKLECAPLSVDPRDWGDLVLMDPDSGDIYAAVPDEVRGEYLTTRVNGYDVLVAALVKVVRVFPASGMFRLADVAPAVDTARAALKAAGVE